MPVQPSRPVGGLSTVAPAARYAELAQLLEDLLAIEHIATGELGVGDGEEFIQFTWGESARSFISLKGGESGADGIVRVFVPCLLHALLDEALGFGGES